jgi:thiamine kinase-like enzyme
MMDFSQDAVADRIRDLHTPLLHWGVAVGSPCTQIRRKTSAVNAGTNQAENA